MLKKNNKYNTANLIQMVKTPGSSRNTRGSDCLIMLKKMLILSIKKGLTYS